MEEMLTIEHILSALLSFMCLYTAWPMKAEPFTMAPIAPFHWSSSEVRP